MTTPRNPVDEGKLVNLRTARLTDAQEIGSGAGGRVVCFRYHGSTNPDGSINKEDEAWIEPFLFKYKVGTTEFSYLAVKIGVNQQAIQPDRDAAYWLFKNYLKDYLAYTEAKKKNPEAQLNPPTPPAYALSYAADWIIAGRPETVIATKLEVIDVEEVTETQQDGSTMVVGLNFTTSNAEAFLRKMRANIGSTPAHSPHNRGIQSAITTDLAITIGQIFGSFDESHYQLLTRKHPGVIHGDLALRNGLVRLIESEAAKKLPHAERIPVKYSVHITDLGLAILTDDVKSDHKQTTHDIPIRWCDAKRLREGQISLVSDLYAKRISFFESLALLEGSYDNFYYMISPNYDEHNPKYPDLIPIGQFVTTVGNDAALRHYMDNCRNKHLVKNEESLLYLSCFERYLDVQKSTGKSLDQITIEEDKQLLEECFDQYFEKLLTLKFRSCETDPEAFLVSMHRLLNMRVSDKFKAEPIYQAVQAFAAKLPLEKTYSKEEVLTAVQDLQILMTSNRIESLMQDVKSSQTQYEVNILKAKSLLDQDNLTVSDFNSLANEIDYWQDLSHQIPSLQEKINALKQELEQLAKLLGNSRRQNEQAKRDLMSTLHQLELLQPKLHEDQVIWQNLVTKREETFKQEQALVYEKILKLKQQYEEAVDRFSKKDDVINTGSPTVELGKILHLFLSLENLFYEYQRLGRYDVTTSEALQSFFKAEVLKDFYNDPAYKTLLRSFQQERHKNSEKHHEAERKYRASKNLSEMEIATISESTPNPVVTTQVEAPVTSNAAIPPTQQYGTQPQSQASDKDNQVAPVPYALIPNPETDARKRATTSPTPVTPVSKKAKNKAQVTYGAMPAEPEENTNQATISQYGSTQSQDMEDIRTRPTNYKTLPNQNDMPDQDIRIASGRKLQKTEPPTVYGSVPSPGQVIPTTNQYGTTQQNTAANENKEKATDPYMMMPDPKRARATTSPTPITESAKESTTPYRGIPPQEEVRGHTIPSTNQYGTVQTQKTSNNDQTPASAYISMRSPNAQTNNTTSSPTQETQKDVYGSMPNPDQARSQSETQAKVVLSQDPSALGYTSPVLNINKQPDQQKDSDAMVVDTATPVEEATPIIDADAAARYVTALNALIDYGIGSIDDIRQVIEFAELARDSEDNKPMSAAIANLGELMIYIQAVGEARKNYYEATHSKMLEPTDLVAVAALKGVESDLNKITKANQIPVEIIPTFVDLIDQIIKSSKELVNSKDRSASLPPQPSNSNLQETLENAYKQELEMVTQLQALYAYFYNEENGQLKTNQELAMDLSLRERLALEHLLKPYKELLLALPVFEPPTNLNTGEGQREAVHEIISWRTHNKTVLEKITSCAKNQATLVAMTQNLPEATKNMIHAGLTAPVQNATTMAATLDNIQNQEQINTNLKALLSNASTKLKKPVEAILRTVKTSHPTSAKEAFAHNKEAIKTVQRNKIRSLHNACVNHFKQVIPDETMASKMIALLDLLANYGVNQRTDDIGLLKIKKVQELLTGMLQQNSPENILEFIHQKLLRDAELHEHKHFGGDTQLVRYLHQMESVLGKKDVANTRPKALTIKKDNPVTTREKATLDLQYAILSLLDTTIRLEAGLDNLAKAPQEREQREFIPLPKNQSKFCLFSSKKRKREETVELPITPPTPNHQ